MTRGTGGTSADPVKQAARHRVMGRYTTDSKGQRTYHAPEESTTYGPEGGRSVPIKPTEASRFPNKRY